MAQLPTPTTRELEILKVLWELGPSSVREVHRHFAEREDIAYNTLQTLLRVMTTKQLVTYEQKGRTFIYTACFSRDESTARFLDRVFDGAASQLVMSLLRSEDVSVDELRQMQAMIDDAYRAKSNGKEDGGSE